MEVPSKYWPSYSALARNIGKTKSFTKVSRRSSTKISLMPNISAFLRAGSNSSPWPRSAVKVTTSQRYVVCSQRRITLVSSPPE